MEETSGSEESSLSDSESLVPPNKEMRKKGAMARLPRRRYGRCDLLKRQLC